ncbi:MAG: hypothetical protein FWB72_05605 [Firmicutes bacterium]|nr:hypothetical protein [Bacillota bacterium]
MSSVWLTACGSNGGGAPNYPPQDNNGGGVVTPASRVAELLPLVNVQVSASGLITWDAPVGYTTGASVQFTFGGAPLSANASTREFQLPASTFNGLPANVEQTLDITLTRQQTTIAGYIVTFTSRTQTITFTRVVDTSQPQIFTETIRLADLTVSMTPEGFVTLANIGRGQVVETDNPESQVGNQVVNMPVNTTFALEVGGQTAIFRVDANGAILNLTPAVGVGMSVVSFDRVAGTATLQATNLPWETVIRIANLAQSGNAFSIVDGRITINKALLASVPVFGEEITTPPAPEYYAQLRHAHSITYILGGAGIEWQRDLFGLTGWHLMANQLATFTVTATTFWGVAIDSANIIVEGTTARFTEEFLWTYAGTHIEWQVITNPMNQAMLPLGNAPFFNLSPPLPSIELGVAYISNLKIDGNYVTFTFEAQHGRIDHPTATLRATFNGEELQPGSYTISGNQVTIPLSSIPTFAPGTTALIGLNVRGSFGNSQTSSHPQGSASLHRPAGQRTQNVQLSQLSIVINPTTRIITIDNFGDVSANAYGIGRQADGITSTFDLVVGGQRVQFTFDGNGNPVVVGNANHGVTLTLVSNENGRVQLQMNNAPFSTAIIVENAIQSRGQIVDTSNPAETVTTNFANSIQASSSEVTTPNDPNIGNYPDVAVAVDVDTFRIENGIISFEVPANFIHNEGQRIEILATLVLDDFSLDLAKKIIVSGPSLKIINGRILMTVNDFESLGPNFVFVPGLDKQFRFKVFASDSSSVSESEILINITQDHLPNETFNPDHFNLVAGNFNRQTGAFPAIILPSQVNNLAFSITINGTTTPVEISDIVSNAGSTINIGGMFTATIETDSSGQRSIVINASASTFSNDAYTVELSPATASAPNFNTLTNINLGSFNVSEVTQNQPPESGFTNRIPCPTIAEAMRNAFALGPEFGRAQDSPGANLGGWMGSAIQAFENEEGTRPHASDVMTAMLQGSFSAPAGREWISNAITTSLALHEGGIIDVEIQVRKECGDYATYTVGLRATRDIEIITRSLNIPEATPHSAINNIATNNGFVIDSITRKKTHFGIWASENERISHRNERVINVDLIEYNKYGIGGINHFVILTYVVGFSGNIIRYRSYIGDENVQMLPLQREAWNGGINSMNEFLNSTPQFNNFGKIFNFNSMKEMVVFMNNAKYAEEFIELQSMFRLWFARGPPATALPPDILGDISNNPQRGLAMVAAAGPLNNAIRDYVARSRDAAATTFSNVNRLNAHGDVVSDHNATFADPTCDDVDLVFFNFPKGILPNRTQYIYCKKTNTIVG